MFPTKTLAPFNGSPLSASVTTPEAPMNALSTKESSASRCCFHSWNRVEQMPCFDQSNFIYLWKLVWRRILAAGGLDDDLHLVLVGVVEVARAPLGHVPLRAVGEPSYVMECYGGILMKCVWHQPGKLTQGQVTFMTLFLA